jgi:hypothetical protein
MLYLDTTVVSLARRFKAAVMQPMGSAYMMRGPLYNPKNPEYAASHDTESTKGALDSMLLKLRDLNIPVTTDELGSAFIERLPEKIKKHVIMYGLDRLAGCESVHPPTDYYYQKGGLSTSRRSRSNVRSSPPTNSRRGATSRCQRCRRSASNVARRSTAARDAATTTRGVATPDAAAAAGI